MPEIKITYFDVRGRAEPCRLALVIGGIPFEDERFTWAQFPEIKERTPYKAVPIITVDGKVYAQSHAILRYFGRMTGLYPVDDALEALRIDEVVDTISDLFASVYSYMGDDVEQRRTAREKMLKEDVPKFMGGLEKRFETFGDGPFAVGDNVTIADLGVLSIVNMFKCGCLDFIPIDALDGFSRLIKAYDAVMEMPRVKEWCKKHPIKNVTDI